jgi:hypothetical protein
MEKVSADEEMTCTMCGDFCTMKKAWKYSEGISEVIKSHKTRNYENGKTERYHRFHKDT